MSPRRIAPLVALLFVFAWTATARQVETGFASWYNRGFHGLRTANGENYDHEALTAAHRTLPFGTHVRVTRLDTGANVVVRINDRMPEGPGHVIDLSGAAARQLELLRVGISRVSLEVVPARDAATAAPPPRPNRPDQAATPRPDPPAGVAAPVPTRAEAGTASSRAAGYTLQLGAFTRIDTAQMLAAQYERAYIVATGASTGARYRVFFGSFADAVAARAEQARLWDHGQDSVLRPL